MYIGIIITAAAGPTMAKDIFVDKSGGGQATTIQVAVELAQNGDAIIVEPGNYPENIVIEAKKDITIKPLMAITPPSVTIQGVAGRGAVVAIRDCKGVDLSGLRIVGGTAAPKNVVSVESSKATLRQCRIENGRSCGIYIASQSVVSLNDDIISNHYTGILFYESRGEVHYCRMYSNTNNGIHITNKSHVSAIHNTFHQNQKIALLCEWSSKAKIFNSIFSGNGTAIRGKAEYIEADYNLFHGNGTDTKGIEPSPHDLSADPRFVDEARFDFSLAADSPAKNSDSDGLDRGGILPH